LDEEKGVCQSSKGSSNPLTRIPNVCLSLTSTVWRCSWTDDMKITSVADINSTEMICSDAAARTTQPSAIHQNLKRSPSTTSGCTHPRYDAVCTAPCQAYCTVSPVCIRQHCPSPDMPLIRLLVRQRNTSRFQYTNNTCTFVFHYYFATLTCVV